ncbi:MAG: hypothetical protein ACR2QR_12165 [Woeseiaceae bacterium]
MKKFLLIMLLCVFQGACASNPAVVSDENTLLSYADLANEITVAHENIARRGADPVFNDEPVDTP